MSTTPLQQLELKALEQRNRMHQVIAEAKIQVAATKEKLDVKKNIRKHLFLAVAIACGVGLSAGYGAGGMAADIKKNKK
ncbi:MAG: hypothetical protein ABJA69_10500 [Acidobacteriaceae bacterium]